MAANEPLSRDALDLVGGVLAGPLRSGAVPDPAHASPEVWAEAAPVLIWNRLGGMGWEVLSHTRAGAESHGPEPLSDGGGESRPPEPAADVLQASFLRESVQTTLLLELAHRVRGVLSREGLDSVLFKGAALVEAGVYADPGQCPMEDADVLVRVDQAEAAVEALMAAGLEPWVDWDPHRVGWLPSLSLHDPASADGMDLSLDLHWQVPYGRFRADPLTEPEPLWMGADLEAGLPAAEAHAVVLAQHVVKHLRVVTHLRGLADFVRVLDRCDDPDRFARHVRLRRMEHGMPVLLAFLRDEVGVALPDWVGSVLGPIHPLRGPASEILTLTRLAAPEPLARGRVDGLRIQWAVERTPLEAIGEAAHTAWPSAAWLEHRYPDAGNAALRRMRYATDLARWTAGLGRSPLSPNQELYE
jgi:hypothetical protein